MKKKIETPAKYELPYIREYHATLKILASKHYFIIYYKYHASCIFERPDKIVLGRLGYDCRTRWLFDNYLF